MWTTRLFSQPLTSTSEGWAICHADDSKRQEYLSFKEGVHVKFVAEFETNIGPIKAEWDGGHFVALYRHNEAEPSTTFNVWDYEHDKPLFAVTPAGMARHTQEWLWEIERGIEFESIRCTSSLFLHVDTDG